MGTTADGQNKQTGRQTETDRDRQTQTDTDRQTDRQTETETYRDRPTDRDPTVTQASQTLPEQT